jgi:hypothetical protein
VPEPRTGEKVLGTWVERTGDQRHSRAGDLVQGGPVLDAAQQRVEPVARQRCGVAVSHVAGVASRCGGHTFQTTKETTIPSTPPAITSLG